MVYLQIHRFCRPFRPQNPRILYLPYHYIFSFHLSYLRNNIMVYHNPGKKFLENRCPTTAFPKPKKQCHKPIFTQKSLPPDGADHRKAQKRHTDKSHKITALTQPQEKSRRFLFVNIIYLWFTICRRICCPPTINPRFLPLITMITLLRRLC